MPPLTDTEIKNAAIAIVDDEPANVLLVERTLSGAGYRTLHSTTDSRQALELIRRHRPALLLLDLNMPHLNGLQLMAQMAATLSDPPTVVVLTAQTALEHRLNVLQQGARDFISKPFEIPELLARVHNSLETHLLQARLRNDNILLEQRVAERTQELHDSRLEIIRRLGRAAEFRDNETGLHIIRMSKYSELLGRCAGMSDGEAELLLQASPMHDIGKIGIPDQILLKPGKLNAEEWETMKQHAQIGADLLDGSSAPLLVVAREIALTHHEKWDGSGYPHALRGESIPLVGRIVAVADVFDALTSERPYKAAWPIPKAIELLQAERDRHFDGRLVDLFIANLDAVLAIRERHAEPHSGSEATH